MKTRPVFVEIRVDHVWVARGEVFAFLRVGDGVVLTADPIDDVLGAPEAR